MTLVGRTSWIAVCALAVIGALFVALKLLWLLHVDYEWLPYPVHVVAAALAGLAMAKSSPSRSPWEPFAGGVVAVAVLAAVSFGLPKAFTLTAARVDHWWLVLPMIIAVSGLGCAGGAWLAGSSTSSRSVWIAVTAAMTSACMILLGLDVAVAIGLPREVGAVIVATSIAAFVAGAGTQTIVASERGAAIVAGVTAFIAFGIAEQVITKRTVELSIMMIVAMVAPILAAGVGARVAWRGR
jgi:hypothetical protein